MSEPSRKELARELAGVIRCYDRDNLPPRRRARPSGLGVLVFLTDRHIERLRVLLNDEVGEAERA